MRKTNKIELSSGTVDTADITEEHVGQLVSLLSFMDNCIEEGDLKALSDNHMNITELMVEIGLTPSYMRQIEEEELDV